MAFHWDSGWTCPFLSIYSYRHTWLQWFQIK
jgi:hypothetical protein